MKISMALASAVLLASTLGACGGGDGDNGGANGDYCKDLKKVKASYSDLSSGNLVALDKTFTTFHKLADEAPSEIKGDWKTLDDGLSTLENALKDAGLKLSDLPKIQQGQIPKDIDESKLPALAREMGKLSSSDLEKASKAIEAHAKKTCKLDLNAS